MTDRPEDRLSPSNSNIFSQVTHFIDNNLRVIKYVSVYGVAGVGVVLILRSTHALRKFRDVKDVPRNFIRLHAQLHGHVTKVTDTGQLLVNHTPVISIGKGAEGQLPVSLAGVKLNQLAHPWLQETFPGKHVWFKIIRLGTDQSRHKPTTAPLPALAEPAGFIIENDSAKGDSEPILEQTIDKCSDQANDENYNQPMVDAARPASTSAIVPVKVDEVLECIVTTKKGWLRNMIVNEELVRRGFATVSDIEGLEEDKDVTKLLKRLLKAEIKAERKGFGIWERPSLRERAMNYPRYLKNRLVNYVKSFFSRKKMDDS